MILRSPNLEHLELHLQESTRDENFMSPGWLVEAIAPVLQHTFENLQVFRLGGTANIDSEFLLRPEEGNLIRSFLFRHPKIHTLQLPWDWEMNFLIEESQEEASKILHNAVPNLRMFEGPSYLILVLMNLDIAQRLEHLVIPDVLEDEVYELEAFAAALPPLPNLRRLDIMLTYTLDDAAFARVLKATPNLTELTVQWIEGDPVSIKVPLSLALLMTNLGDCYTSINRAETSQDTYPWIHRFTSPDGTVIPENHSSTRDRRSIPVRFEVHMSRTATHFAR
jgi:hypothetical protein